MSYYDTGLKTKDDIATTKDDIKCKKCGKRFKSQTLYQKRTFWPKCFQCARSELEVVLKQYMGTEYFNRLVDSFIKEHNEAIDRKGSTVTPVQQKQIETTIVETEIEKSSPLKEIEPEDEMEEDPLIPTRKPTIFKCDICGGDWKTERGFNNHKCEPK